ncbi:hypothetical protein SAMN05192566_1567 [Methylophilus rhizosphaerae]|uniref:Uncharacterized protein n=1 Tax=Methylophilus rhizosphaerae TaxID=492660 RepID=A0A1G9CQ00_9PROT|nr:hypothetical protein SAMN05192566_1567 [Methylophilus rhizosphaerae]
MEAYTLKQHKSTGELHLFVGRFNPPKSDFKCTSSSLSICEKMSKSDSKSNEFTCLTEDEARVKCAEIGRSVCGICVSNLYATYR